jgi:hypothetical protein
MHPRAASRSCGPASSEAPRVMPCVDARRRRPIGSRARAPSTYSSPTASGDENSVTGIPERQLRQQLLGARPTLDRPPPRHLAKPDPRPHPRARQLAQPSRDLVLDHATQSTPTQQLHRPRHPRAAPTQLRPPLPADRPAVRVEVHPAKTSIAYSTSSTPHTPPISSLPEPIRARTSEPDH